MDALRSALPAGTLSGAPKVRAMQIIDELEPVKRGGYGGAIGYLSYNGDLDTAIHIRTVVVKDGVAHVQAGGGTVADAKPAYEYNESVTKATAVLRAVELACEQTGLAVSADARPRHRQLRLLHLQPRPVPGRAGGGDRGRCATTRPPSTSCWRAAYDRVVVSPGPCTPAEAGISVEAVRALRRGRHADARGVPRPPGARRRRSAGRVIQRDPVHGKATEIAHDGRTIFAGLPTPLTSSGATTRWSSTPSCPDCLEVSRATAAACVMGAPPPRAARRGRAVPPRVGAHRRRASTCWPTSSPGRADERCPTCSSPARSTPSAAGRRPDRRSGRRGARARSCAATSPRRRSPAS